MTLLSLGSSQVQTPLFLSASSMIWSLMNWTFPLWSMKPTESQVAKIFFTFPLTGKGSGLNLTCIPEQQTLPVSVRITMLFAEITRSSTFSPLQNWSFTRVRSLTQLSVLTSGFARVPRTPPLFLPQVYRLPFSNSRNVKVWDEQIFFTALCFLSARKEMSSTSWGIADESMPRLWRPYPQPQTLPFSARTREKSCPAATDLILTSSRRDTMRGSKQSIFTPFPRGFGFLHHLLIGYNACEPPPNPQEKICPSLERARLCRVPQANCWTVILLEWKKSIRSGVQRVVSELCPSLPLFPSPTLQTPEDCEMNAM